MCQLCDKSATRVVRLGVGGYRRSHGEAALAGRGGGSQRLVGPVKFREIIRRIEDGGWVLVAQRGSHRQYEHPTKPGKVTVAGKPNADVPTGTAMNNLRQAGLRRSKG